MKKKVGEGVIPPPIYVHIFIAVGAFDFR